MKICEDSYEDDSHTDSIVLCITLWYDVCAAYISYANFWYARTEQNNRNQAAHQTDTNVFTLPVGMGTLMRKMFLSGPQCTVSLA